MVRRNKSENNLKNIDFSMNSSPFRISNKILKKINLNPEVLYRYPFPNSEGMLSILSKFLKINKNNLMVSNGSTEIFFLLPSIFKFKRALVIIPSFWEYEHTLSLYGSRITFFKILPKGNFFFDKEKFEVALRKVDCVYICNPNNPTSTYIDKEVILLLLKKFKNKMFIVDETYLLFSEDYIKKTLNPAAIKYNNLIVVSSFSKIFSVGGLRIGFCVASKKNLALIRKYKNPYSVNIIAELIFPYLLKNKKYLDKTRFFIKKERERVFRELKTIEGIKPYKPYANFILIRIENNKILLLKLIDYLRGKNILIREGNIFRGLSKKFFRVNIKTKKENDLLIKYLKKFISKVK